MPPRDKPGPRIAHFKGEDSDVTRDFRWGSPALSASVARLAAPAELGVASEQSADLGQEDITISRLSQHRPDCFMRRHVEC